MKKEGRISELPARAKCPIPESLQVSHLQAPCMPHSRFSAAIAAAVLLKLSRQHGVFFNTVLNKKFIACRLQESTQSALHI